jgi:GDP-mannose 6-dehydrogenase
MDVSVFGLGYVGCVTAACLAKRGHCVVGVDVNGEKVAAINAGQSPIVEAGLSELLADVVAHGLLSATVHAAEAVRKTQLALVCVGTPGLGHGRPDVDAVERVGVQIGEVVARQGVPFTVVLRSTVLPGTTERILQPALARAAAPYAACIRTIVNPEFMREGSAIHDFDHPPFVVTGSSDPGAIALMTALYGDVMAPFVHTDVRTAELVKYASNAFHGLKVCFANEIARLCDALGADAQEVSRIFLMDRKLNLSDAYLRPGFAFGGSCLPKDVRALVWASRTNDVDVPVLSAILPSNDGHIRAAVDAILQSKKRRIGVVGLAFKPGTDDVRESPMVTLVETLIGKGCEVRVLDRNVALAKLIGANRRYIEAEIPHLAALLCDRVDELVRHADALVIGSATQDAVAALGLVEPGCPVFDLTRGSVRQLVGAALPAMSVEPAPTTSPAGTASCANP